MILVHLGMETYLISIFITAPQQETIRLCVKFVGHPPESADTTTRRRKPADRRSRRTRRLSRRVSNQRIAVLSKTVRQTEGIFPC